jgi:hypothetical protein
MFRLSPRHVLAFGFMTASLALRLFSSLPTFPLARAVPSNLSGWSAHRVTEARSTCGRKMETYVRRIAGRRPRFSNDEPLMRTHGRIVCQSRARWNDRQFSKQSLQSGPYFGMPLRCRLLRLGGVHATVSK